MTQIKSHLLTQLTSVPFQKWSSYVNQCYDVLIAGAELSSSASTKVTHINPGYNAPYVFTRMSTSVIFPH